MTPVEYIAAAVAIGATATGTYVAVDSANQQAKAQRDAAQLELNQYTEEKKAATDQAAQAEAAARREQQAAASALAARRAANGLDPYGPTGRVLLDDMLEEGAAEIEAIRANFGRSTSRLTYGGLASTQRASAAASTARSNATGAVINGIGSIANTGYRYLSASQQTPARTPSGSRS